MPRNGLGTYNLPTGQPVVTGTTISSSTFNAAMNDIATALTQSVSSDGQTPMAANLNMGGFALNNASAATITTATITTGNVSTLNIDGVDIEGASGASKIGMIKAISAAILTNLNSYLNGQQYSLVTDFGLLGDGSDESVKLQTVLNAIPAGSTLYTGDKNKLYGTSAMLTLSKFIKITGNARFKYVGAGSPAAVIQITDSSVWVEDIDVDANSLCLNSIVVQGVAAIPNGIYFNKTKLRNTKSDATLQYAGLLVIAAAGYGSAFRPKNIVIEGIETYNTGTHGFLPAYCDNIFMYGWSHFQDAANHGWEAVQCNYVYANEWISERCGKFGGGVGDGTKYFEIANFWIDKCANDGSFSVEHNCQYGSVHDFTITDAYYPGLNISYGTSSNGNLNTKNVNVYNGYCSAHVSNSTTPGINCYGSTGAGLHDNVNIWNVTLDGFNRAADYFYAKNGKCDVTLQNPRGSNTYVIKGTLVKNVDILGKCDYQVLDHAYQITSYAGTDSSDCRIVGQVLQAGSTSNKAVVYIDGAGSGFEVTAKTGGASNYLYTSASARCVLFNSMGGLTGTPWGGVCNPVASYGNANNSMDFTSVGVTRSFSATNNAGAPNFTNRVPPYSVAYFIDGDEAVAVTYTSATPSKWRYKGSTTTWVSQGNFV